MDMRAIEEYTETIHVRISKATETVWEGQARSLSSVNSSGPFDILPMHANFISLVKDRPIRIIEQNGHEFEYSCKQAVIYVASNEAKIYVDI